jgi:prephenate dehydrogenase
VSTPAGTAQNRAASNADSAIRRIGVIGLGHMGSDFADNLIADGYQVTVYDLKKSTSPHLSPKEQLVRPDYAT